ncbi:PEP-CTERM sorting domain-containing protein [Reinekea marinisedimentorum]|uniref:Putative secreted protein with PEP-CTERM sorting signal n=1 Tax=Reinekea marinisedimentorum TaxID=230495 RepID=A0A4R3I9X7_9GAMM|nr:PEP-CTERM sorting domain-containing protein [Reinekea marinisedimentorum]TCS41115.1 putative secreted protein with PEP-CTERM sorting signal [Reinekea marinisedimentorum]
MNLLKLIPVLLLTVSPAFGYFISDSSGTTDVGSLDSLLAVISKSDMKDFGNGSNETTEANWVNSILPTSFTSEDASKNEKVGATLVDGESNIWAFELTTGAGYYVIKNSTWWALLLNNDSTSWGVIDTSLSGLSEFNLNDLEISHVTEFKVPIPEPSSLLLFGMGIAGLVGARKYRKS